MKSKKRSSPDREWTDQERRLREHLWSDPGIVERLFADDAWKSYADDLPRSVIPSEQMSTHLQESMAADRRDKIRSLRRMRQRQQLARYAIAAVVLLFCGLLSWQVWFSGASDQFAGSPIAAVTPLLDTSSTILVNESQQPNDYTLPDGSQVTLYAHAKLTYPSIFSPDNREVHLEGKAYFDIEKDSSRPFSVYAGATKTTALGTSFTINTREKNQHTSVTLHSGRVAVSPIRIKFAIKRTILHQKGEQILIDTRSKVVAHRLPSDQPRARAVRHVSQKSQNIGLLEMANIPLAEVMNHLSKAYGSAILFDEPALQHILYTGTVDLSKEQLHDVLTIICLINDLRYIKQPDGSYLLLRQVKEQEINAINPRDSIIQ